MPELSEQLCTPLKIARCPVPSATHHRYTQASSSTATSSCLKNQHMSIRTNSIVGKLLPDIGKDHSDLAPNPIAGKCIKRSGSLPAAQYLCQRNIFTHLALFPLRGGTRQTLKVAAPLVRQELLVQINRRHRQLGVPKMHVEKQFGLMVYRKLWKLWPQRQQELSNKTTAG